MTQTLFFLQRLLPGVDPAAYERWVEEVDYPRVRTIRAILEYSVMRITQGIDSDTPPFDYIERVVVSDFDTYQAERKGRADRAQFLAQSRALVAPAAAFVVETVGEPVA